MRDIRYLTDDELVDLAFDEWRRENPGLLGMTRRSRWPVFRPPVNQHGESACTPCKIPLAGELLALLDLYERHRADMDAVFRDIHALLGRQPALREIWAKFMEAGGTCADDLRRWLNGEPIGDGRRLPSRQHLRLVAARAFAPTQA
jgi:hypothetical protein